MSFILARRAIGSKFYNSVKGNLINGISHLVEISYPVSLKMSYFYPIFNISGHYSLVGSTPFGSCR